MDMSIVAKGCHYKNENTMANNVKPDGMAHVEPSYLNLHCLQRYWFWSAGVKGLNYINGHQTNSKNRYVFLLYGFLDRLSHNSPFLLNMYTIQYLTQVNTQIPFSHETVLQSSK